MKLLFIFFFSIITLNAQGIIPFYGYDSSYPGLYPETSKYVLSLDSLKKIDQTDLSIMRNEIFARKGYIFNSNKWSKYFTQCDWYHPLYNNVDSLITDIEKKNMLLIKEAEKFYAESNQEYFSTKRVYSYEYENKDSIITIADSLYKYKLSFPSAWFLRKHIRISEQSYSNISIDNQRDLVVVAGANGPFTSNGSKIILRVWNCPNCKDITDWYNESSSLPPKQIKNRLSEVKDIKIGGHELYALTNKSNYYEFVYNGLLYQFNFMTNNGTNDIDTFKYIWDSFSFIE